jgi:hypothetical protein
MKHHATAFLLALSAVASRSAQAAEVQAHFRLDSTAMTNTYLDASRESDVVMRPLAELALDFGSFWTAGYTGELRYFFDDRHRDLASAWQEAYVYLNPAWGKDGQNEYTAELRAQWLLNQEPLRSGNVLQPGLLQKLVLEPNPRVRWQSSLELGYRRYYNDTTSDSVEGRAETALSFHLPTRTSATPRLVWALRRYRTPIQLDPESAPVALDQQIELGLHVAQGLWRTAGLQLDYSYLPSMGNNALLVLKLRNDVFFYLGEDFLFAGQRAKAVFKQLIGPLTAELSLTWEVREFNGWPLSNDAGQVVGQRRDERWAPRALLRYAYVPPERSAWLGEAGFSLDYQFLRQGSNVTWYDTSAQTVSLAAWGKW